ncbi:MAG TPA: glycosyltransferase family 2 protein [Acidobacteriota bacterium]|nr:glycosyltransferase family 2 protein [Acidobacteriota bacterium]
MRPCRPATEGTSLLGDDLPIHLSSRWPHTLPESTLQAALNAPPARFSNASDAPQLSIVIPVHNQLAVTQLCLHSLAVSLQEESCQVIVVDNASSDGTQEMLEKLVELNPCCRAILNDRNHGFAPAVNRGLAQAEGDILVILNNDTLLPPGWLRGLRRALEDPSVGLAGPCTNKSGNESEIPVEYRTWGELALFTQRLTHQYTGKNKQSPLLDLPMLSMFCLAMSRKTYRCLGPLDERFQIGMFEDDDYSRRARQMGLRTVCVEDSFVHHFGQATFSSTGDAGEYQRLMEINRRRYERKWGRPWRPHGRRQDLAYQRLRRQIVGEAEGCLSSEAALLVAAKGDERLLQMLNRRCRHILGGPGGEYAGHHPEDSAAIIEQVRRGREEGFTYLLLPQTTLWWLDHYRGLADYLTAEAQLVLDRPQCLKLFHLHASAGGGGS